MKTARLIAAIALAFAATTATAARKIEVKVTNYSGEPLIGYWVEYEINGIKYRSDRAGVRMNQIAWEHMSDEDRETTVRNVYGVFNARRDQFGDKAEELGYWFDKKQGWVQGAETLTIGLVKRDFPEVYKKMNTDWRSLITIEGYDSKKPFATSPEIDKIKEEAALVRSWADKAYQTLSRAVYIRTSVGVKAISGGLIELICDKVLVPNITPAGAGGYLASAIGTALDYVNNITHLQSKIIDNVVAKRPTTEQTLAVVNNCDMTIAQSRGFIDLCFINYEKLMAEYYKKGYEYGAELDAKAKEVAVTFPLVVTENAGYVAAELTPLRENTVAKRKSLDDVKVRSHTEEELENAQNEYDDAVEAYETCRSKYGEILESVRKSLEGQQNSIDDIVAKIDAIKAPEAPAIYASLHEEERTQMRRNAEKYISEIEAYYSARASIAVKETFGSLWSKECTLYSLRKELARDDDLYNGRDFYEDSYPKLSGGNIETAWQHCDTSVDSVNKERRIAEIREALKKADEQVEQYKKNLQTHDAYLKESEPYKQVMDAKKAYDDAYKALNEFLDAMPTFVTEQETNDADSMYPGIFPQVTDSDVVDPYDGRYVILNQETELGRAFLAEGAQGTAATASAYRKRLDELNDQFCSLKAQADCAADFYYAQRRVFTFALGFDDESDDHYHYNREPEYRKLLPTYGELTGLALITINGRVQKSNRWRDDNWYDVTRKARNLVLLARDFNNRNTSHEIEMGAYGILSVESNRTEFTEKILPDPSKDLYVRLSGSARCLARDAEWGTNPNSLYGYWNGGEYDLDATNEYHRGVASYAYFAPGYYESKFGGEPDPFRDFVEPILNEIDAARQAHGAAIVVPAIYTVAFDGNGGSVSSATRIVANGSAVGELPTATWAGWVFNGWYTEAHGGKKVTEATIVSADMTFYAQWTQDGGGGGGQGGEGGGGSVTPGYEVIEEGDIVAAYAAPKAVVLPGAVYDGNAVAGIVELKLAKVNEKKGTSKVSGSFTGLDGKKITLKAVPVEGIDGRSPKTVSLVVKGVGTMTVTIGGTQFAGSLGGSHVQSATVGGDWTGRGATVTVDAPRETLPAGTQEQLLPNDEQATVNGGKWSFSKAASVKWAKPKKGAERPEIFDEASGKGLIVDTSKGKTNLSGMKITNTPKKGTFKGKFTLYALEGAGKSTKLKKYSVNVTGVVVNGVGYGVATCKKPALSWSVTVR